MGVADDYAMAITVRQLLSVPELKLRLIYDGGGNAVDSGIVWVHPTDVVNAAEYAEAGEILLTCSTNFPLESMRNANDMSLLKRDCRKVGLPSVFKSNEEAYRKLWMRYVSELSRAGVTAIGFGVKMKHPTIPVALVDAVQQHHIVLFEVPVEINFSQISKTVIRRQAEEIESIQRIMYSAQRELFKASCEKNPIQAVVLQVARMSGGWAAFVDQQAHVAAISNQSMHKRAAQFAERIRKKKERDDKDAKTAFGVSDAGNQYCACLVGDEGRTLGLIIVSSAKTGSYGMVLRSLSIAAADALSWSLPQQLERLHHENALRSVAMTELARGLTESAMTLMSQLWRWVPRFPAKLYCIEYPIDEPRDDVAVSMAVNELGDLNIPFGVYQEHVWLLSCEEKESAVEQWMRNTGVMDFGYTTINDISSSSAAFHKALQSLLLRRAGRSESVLDMTPHELMNPAIAQVYAQELFAPLQTLPEEEIWLLMITLHALMQTAFNVGAAAKHLGVHRHTVENRMGKLERILGLDFAEESARVKVWIASAFVRGREPR